MDWTRVAVGGATRPDSFSGMDPRFAQSLAALFQSAPPAVQQALRVGSGYRSIARQQELWNASDKTGHKVARPGHSQHNFGKAADLKYLSPLARQYAQANASRFGLTFPMSYEPWHIELAGARGGQQAAPAGMEIPTAGAAGMLGDVAATPVETTSVPGQAPAAPAFVQLLQGQQQRKLKQAEEERLLQEQRAALFTPPAPLGAPPKPNVWSLYG